MTGGTSVDDVLDLAGQLEGVTVTDLARYSKLQVQGLTFGYVWPATRTAGLKQTLAEQEALVLERPDVFEVQFTAGGFGWVVGHLDRIDRAELAELVFEAWRLTAPASLLTARGDRLPT